MARRTKFTPDVTIGEMALVGQLCEFMDNAPGSPAPAAARANDVSLGVIIAALDRVAEAVGPIETAGKRRRTLRPNELGRTVGSIGYLARLLLQIAQDSSTDQDKFRFLLRHLVKVTLEASRAGDL